MIDAKRSSVSAASRKFLRVTLPRVTDVVLDTLEQFWQSWELPVSDFEWFVADFSDAFYHIPLAHAEQRFFTVRLRGHYYVLLRTAQGSRGAPLTWALTVSLLGRLTQSLFETSELRLNTYVDDPIMGVRGPFQVRNVTCCIVILIWSALNFQIAIKKIKRGPQITWTSAMFSVLKSADDVIVTAQIKPGIVHEVREQTNTFLANNVLSKNDLRSYIGKVSHIASLVFALRPFLAEIWACLTTDLDSNAPANCVWTRQIAKTLRWIAAFLNEASASIILRRFSARALFNDSTKIDLILDASPWGIGGVLIIDGTPYEYFADKLTPDDEKILRFVIGTAAGQQTVEALAVLVAFTLWHPHFTSRRCTLQVKSDSISALYMLCNMTSKGMGSMIIARELALLIALCAFRPDIITHLPGATTLVADELSRKHAPEHTFVLPPYVSGARECLCPPRPATFYRSLAVPRDLESLRASFSSA